MPERNVAEVTGAGQVITMATRTITTAYQIFNEEAKESAFQGTKACPSLSHKVTKAQR